MSLSVLSQPAEADTLSALAPAAGRLRIVIHDYAGHPFQVELSRELARRGHHVMHHHFSGFQTPKGALQRQPGDPATFAVEGLDLGEPFQKHSFIRRRQQEVAYGHLAARAALAFRPDVVIAANIPLDPLRILSRACQAKGIRFVVWLQDLYSVAMRKILPKKLPVVGGAVASYFQLLERRLLREADHIVTITQDFDKILTGWGVPPAKVDIVENWAPLDEITPLPADNDWAREHGLVGRKVVLYSGTLGLKHNPSAISALARSCADRPDVAVVVVSEGAGADWLKAAREREGLGNLLLLPFQPYHRFSEVLATAAVVLAIIDPEAGIFSVPSKVLSYLAAGRPILLSVPPENLAARTVQQAGAGLVARPDDVPALCQALDRLLDDDAERRLMGKNGRAHAETMFAIGRIADRFERVIVPADTSAGRSKERAA